MEDISKNTSIFLYPNRAQILNIIANTNDNIHPAKIARIAGCNNSHVGKTLNLLLAEGYIKKEKPVNKRTINVKITSKGLYISELLCKLLNGGKDYEKDV